MMRLVIRNILVTDPNLNVVASAENGKSALESLDSAQPDLIWLDLEMPVMNGIEFLCVARSKTSAKVVVLSSMVPAGSPKAAEVISLGADAVIAKPSGAVSLNLKEARGTELFTTIYRLLGIGVPVPA